MMAVEEDRCGDGRRGQAGVALRMIVNAVQKRFRANVWRTGEVLACQRSGFCSSRARSNRGQRHGRAVQLREGAGAVAARDSTGFGQGGRCLCKSRAGGASVRCSSFGFAPTRRGHEVSKTCGNPKTAMPRVSHGSGGSKERTQRTCSTPSKLSVALRRIFRARDAADVVGGGRGRVEGIASSRGIRVGGVGHVDGRLRLRLRL